MLRERFLGISAALEGSHGEGSFNQRITGSRDCRVGFGEAHCVRLSEVCESTFCERRAGIACVFRQLMRREGGSKCVVHRRNKVSLGLGAFLGLSEPGRFLGVGLETDPPAIPGCGF